ncbi:hypothetical protein QBC47DRAFT_218903 [Echria macrotheca]|uniref:Uncharacterized protein n=1 Tax=Echria macrotheca TaxID=438768 RepID=A0AAJ0BA42_9PEZI|nr:hypothetical protein QBC47DRAFT_218903 [Echria macrotheca]
MSSCVVREVAWRAPACGLPAAYRPSGRTPLCEQHLCHFGRSGSSRGPRCLEVPLRLVYSVRDSGGLLPDDSESFFCQDHDQYACRADLDDGTRCPEERRSGVEYCRAHAESVCRAKTRSGACRSVAMENADYCSQHRCANGLGGRGPEGHCRNRRTGVSSFCDDHICIWRDKEGVRCEKQSPHAKACCAKHTCTRCEFGSEDATTHCIYHLCAYGRRGKTREWPPCEEAVNKEGYCGRHRRERRVEVEVLRPRRIEAAVVGYGQDVHDDDNTEYYSDPDYRPAIAISRVPKTNRSGSSGQFMKRLEYRGVVEPDRESMGSGGSRSSRDRRASLSQQWAVRPWRPWTPHC